LCSENKPKKGGNIFARKLVFQSNMNHNMQVFTRNRKGVQQIRLCGFLLVKVKFCSVFTEFEDSIFRDKSACHDSRSAGPGIFSLEAQLIAYFDFCLWWKGRFLWEKEKVTSIFIFYLCWRNELNSLSHLRCEIIIFIALIFNSQHEIHNVAISAVAEERCVRTIDQISCHEFYIAVGFAAQFWAKFCRKCINHL